jgi:hypothetical protein
LSVYQDWIKLVADWLEMIYDAFTPEVFTLTGGVMKSAIFFEDLKPGRPPLPSRTLRLRARSRPHRRRGPRLSKEASETFCSLKKIGIQSDLFFDFKKPQKRPKKSK